ncbi:AAA family ATPase [Candidatus Micrarchaeota archaeon]|nr:AAA family ATPase [Candidatus Micrarchaeota archaeon]
MIIGVVGYNACGKDTFAKILEDKGYMHISLSDMIREELMKENVQITRDNLIKKGNWLREHFGPSVLADKALDKIKKCEEQGRHDFVITSIRNPYEVDALRKRRDFILIFLDADIRTRFERIRKRNREQAPETFEEFLKQEEKEKVNVDPSKQSILDCIKKSDYKIENNGTVEELKENIENLINQLKIKPEKYGER